MYHALNFCSVSRRSKSELGVFGFVTTPPQYIQGSETRARRISLTLDFAFFHAACHAGPKSGISVEPTYNSSRVSTVM